MILSALEKALRIRNYTVFFTSPPGRGLGALTILLQLAIKHVKLAACFRRVLIG